MSGEITGAKLSLFSIELKKTHSKNPYFSIR